ncbi:DNA/RNA non-specific endonuclease [Burkholderia pseudomallei]|uniref:DNA/RNA non-specific endonuclease n=1 Tax=Burkholderia pseudomallei TaxID=28450 RepID=UPI001364B192
MLNAVVPGGRKERDPHQPVLREAGYPAAGDARLSDYRTSSYDRGHTNPAGDRCNDRATAESFPLAKMVPRNSMNNRRPWTRIDEGADCSMFAICSRVSTSVTMTASALRRAACRSHEQQL